MTGVILMAAGKLRFHKLQAGVLCGGCFFLSFCGLGILLLYMALLPSFDAAYEKLDAPNFCVSVAETDVEKEELEQFLEKLPYAEKYEISKRYLASKAELPDQILDFAYLASSENKSPAPGSVIINNAVPGTKTGDTIRLHINGQTAEFRVESIAVDVVNSAPDNNIPYFYISCQELDRLTEDFEKGSFLVEMWSALDEGQEQQFADDFQSCFGMVFAGECTAMADIRHSFLFRFDVMKEFAAFFFFFFSLVFLVLMVFWVKIEIEEDAGDICILKSLGYTEGKICLVYIFRLLLFGTLGGAAGTAVSAVVMRRWIGSVFSAAGGKDFSFLHLPGYILFVLLALDFAMVMFGWISTVQILYGMREDSGQKGLSDNNLWIRNLFGKKFFGDRKGLVRFQRRETLCFALGLQRCMIQKAETMLVLLLSLGLGTLGLTGIYLIQSVRQADIHLADWGIADMDIYVARKTNVDEETGGLLEQLDREDAVAYYYAALSGYVVCQVEKSGQTRRVPGEIFHQAIPPQLSFSFQSGRNPENDKEAAVGINFARENHVGIGDCLILLHDGERQELTIVGIYPTYKSYANSIRIITPDIRQFFHEQAEGYYSIVLQDGQDVERYARELSESFADFNFFPMHRSTARFVQSLLYPLAFVMSLLLLTYFFLLLLLKKRLYLAKQEEFALLYHIGMTRKKIGKIVRWRFMLPVFTGMVLAVPSSLYAAPLWLRPLAGRLGLLEFPVYPDVPTVAAAFSGILFVGILAFLVRGKQ